MPELPSTTPDSASVSSAWYRSAAVVNAGRMSPSTPAMCSAHAQMRSRSSLGIGCGFWVFSEMFPSSVRSWDGVVGVIA